MAAGNQAEKGACADFVNDAAIRKQQTQDDEDAEAKEQVPSKRSKNKSPQRFLIAVRTPPEREARLRGKTTKKKEVNPSKSQNTKAVTIEPLITKPDMDNRKQITKAQKVRNDNSTSK